MEDKKYTCNDMPKLYSCPFCGSENITIRYGAGGYTSNVHYPNETGFVACLQCGSRSLKTRYAKNAVKKWNTRKESNAGTPKWISVEERLPNIENENGTAKCTETVLGIDKLGYRYVGFFRVYKYDNSFEFVGCDCDGFDRGEFDVTHWMPLPMPPKEET